MEEKRDKGFFDRILFWLGFETEPEEESFEEEGARGRVVSLHQRKEMKVLVVEPKTFEAAQVVANNLKSQQPVIVNLEDVDLELAKRVIDFISGTTYALNGSMRKIGDGVFLFTPNNISIDGKEFEDSDSSDFLWREPDKNRSKKN